MERVFIRRRLLVSVDNESIQYAGADILLQAIEASVVGEEEETEVGFSSDYANSARFNQAKDSCEKFLRESKTKSMERIKAQVFTVAEAYGLALSKMDNRPDELELEMSLSLSLKGEVCIVGAERSSMIKVSMKWSQAQ